MHAQAIGRSRRSALATTGGPFLGIQVAQTQCLSTLLPSCEILTLLPPRPLTLRSLNALRGWLGAPTHYPGQGDIGTGMIHHFDTSMCLFAGFQSAAIPPATYCDSADWIA